MDDAQHTHLQVGDCQIAVARQDNQQARNLVFMHGNSLSSEIWEKQFEGTLYEHFNLFAIDLPGHGDSSPAAHPEDVYALTGYRRVLLEVIRQLNLESFILVGHSLGGHIAIESLPYLQGCEAVVVIGTPPLNKPLDMQALYLPNPYLYHLFSATVPDREIIGLMNAMMRKTNPETPVFLIESCKNTDPQARVQLGKSAAEGQYDNEVEILAGTKVPVMLVLGEEDQMVNLSYLQEISKVNDLHQVVTIPKAGHMAPYENPAFMNKLLVGITAPQHSL